MTTSEGYNGWSNIETWNTNLWLTNHSPGMEQTIMRIIRSHPKKMYSTARIIWFAENLKAYLWIIWEGKTPDGHSLKPVDWMQISASWLEPYNAPERG